MGRTDFLSASKSNNTFQRIVYNLNAMQQFERLVINPITVDNFSALFNCMPVDQASDSLMAST